VAFELGTTNGISLVVDPYGRIVAERHRAWEPGLLEPEFNLERHRAGEPGLLEPEFNLERHRAWEPGLLEPEFKLERLLDNATWRFRRRYCSYTLLGGGRIAGAG